jgi:hypothetical protein
MCDLFNNVVSSSDYIASDNRVINNVLERMWKEAVVSEFKGLSQHLTGGTK